MFANVSIIFVKSIVLASSDSMLSELSDTTRSCVELFLSLFFTKLSLLNERSPVATVTGMVRNIRRTTHTFGNNTVKLVSTILFNKVNGFITSLLGLMFDVCICLK